MLAIVAVCADDAIGNQGDLLFRIRADLQRFRRLTMGKILIYGRKTLATFPGGKPLPKRRNFILSRSLEQHAMEGAEVFPSIDALQARLKALEAKEGLGIEDAVVIGGSSVYEALLPMTKAIEITRIRQTVPADRYFPDYRGEGFRLLHYSPWYEEAQLAYRYERWEREGVSTLWPWRPERAKERQALQDPWSHLTTFRAFKAAYQAWRKADPTNQLFAYGPARDPHALLQVSGTVETGAYMMATSFETPDKALELDALYQSIFQAFPGLQGIALRRLGASSKATVRRQGRWTSYQQEQVTRFAPPYQRRFILQMGPYLLACRLNEDAQAISSLQLLDASLLEKDPLFEALLRAENCLGPRGKIHAPTEAYFSEETRPRLVKDLDQALKAYWNKEMQGFDLPLDLQEGTAFQQKVWKALREIPYGKTLSYEDLALEIVEDPEQARAYARAVGAACAANPVLILQACHRVIGSKGELRGFAAGVAMKAKLLDLERFNY